MSQAVYERLEQVIEDAVFPEVDVALRQGYHVDEQRLDWYAFLEEARPFLEPFYARYGYDLVQSPERYFYLLPISEAPGRRRLTVGEMLVGQGLALMLLDPATVQAAGVVARGQVLELLASLVGEDALLQALNPRRKRRDERKEQELARKEIDRALRTLGRLGFVDAVDDERLRLRAALLRFADPVRTLEDPAAALAQLIERGEVVLEDVDDDEDDDEEDDRCVERRRNHLCS